MRLDRPWLALGLVLGLALSGPGAAQAQADGIAAAAPAPAAYRSLDWDWLDSTRQRRVPVRLYLPEAAGADAPVPLVVFSHGIGGSRHGYSYLGRHWASQGYASLHITATDDVIRTPGYYSGADDRVAVFDATGSARKTLAVFAGGSHSIFIDRAGSGGAQLNAQVKEATRALSIAFLNSVFKGDDGALAAWPQQFAEIVARYTRSPP